MTGPIDAAPVDHGGLGTIVTTTQGQRSATAGLDPARTELEQLLAEMVAARWLSRRITPGRYGDQPLRCAFPGCGTEIFGMVGDECATCGCPMPHESVCERLSDALVSMLAGES